MASLSLQVKHGSAMISLDQLTETSTLLQLQEAIEHATGVMARKQKLLCKGRVLTALPASTTLKTAHVVNGAKIMLLTTAGGAQSQGAAALQASQKAKMEALKERLKSSNGARVTSSSSSLLATTTAATASTMQARIDAWSKTGIAALRDLKLTELPPEMFTNTLCCDNIRVLDLGGNNFSALPPSISNLKKLQKLRLSFNLLTDQGMPWDALCSMTQLVVLALDHNNLVEILESISNLFNLQKLTLDHNNLARLPEKAFSGLVSLKALTLNANLLIQLPTSLSECSLLEELDASKNKIAIVQPEFGRLKNLKTLLINDNQYVFLNSNCTYSRLNYVSYLLHSIIY
jgi:Leucine-rich repeat (LRR) protein